MFGLSELDQADLLKKARMELFIPGYTLSSMTGISNRHGKIFNILAGELVTLMTSGVSFLFGNKP